MNNLNSQSQNQNIQNQLPVNHNILNEFLKSNATSLISQNPTNTQHENISSANPNFDPTNNPDLKDSLNKFLQSKMFSSNIFSNLPLLNGLIKNQQTNPSYINPENPSSTEPIPQVPGNANEYTNAEKLNMQKNLNFNQPDLTLQPNINPPIANLSLAGLNSLQNVKSKFPVEETNKIESNGIINSNVQQSPIKKESLILNSNINNNNFSNLPNFQNSNNNNCNMPPNNPLVNFENLLKMSSTQNQSFPSNISNNDNNIKRQNFSLDQKNLSANNMINPGSNPNANSNSNNKNNNNLLNMLQMTCAMLNNNANQQKQSGNTSHSMDNKSINPQNPMNNSNLNNFPLPPNLLQNLLNLNQPNISNQNMQNKNSQNTTNISNLSNPLSLISALGNISNTNNNVNLNKNFNNNLNLNNEENAIINGNNKNILSSILTKIEENIKPNNIGNVNSESSLKSKPVASNIPNEQNREMSKHIASNPIGGLNPAIFLDLLSKNLSANNSQKELLNNNATNKVNNSVAPNLMNNLNINNLLFNLTNQSNPLTNLLNTVKATATLNSINNNNLNNNADNPIVKNVNQPNNNNNNMNILQKLFTVNSALSQGLGNSSNNTNNQNLNNTQEFVAISKALNKIMEINTATNNKNINNTQNLPKNNNSTNNNNLNNINQPINDNLTHTQNINNSNSQNKNQPALNIGNTSNNNPLPNTNPILGLLSILTANQKDQNANINNNNLHNNNQINNITSNQLKEIANTLPYLKNLQCTGNNSTADLNNKTPKQPENNNSMNSPSSAIKQNPNSNFVTAQNLLTNSPNLSNNPLASILSILNINNDMQVKNNANSQITQNKDEARKSSQNQEEVNSFENAANSFLKLNTSQNNITNLNIFNNLFNIPMNDMKNFNSDSKNLPVDFKNNLFNLGNLTNLVKGQNNLNNQNLNLQNFQKGNQNINFPLNSANQPNPSIFNNLNNNMKKTNIINNNTSNNFHIFQNTKCPQALNSASNNFMSNNALNAISSITSHLQNNFVNNLKNKSQYKSNTPADLKTNFNNTSHGSFSNIQINLNNLSDKQQSFIKQVKYPIEDFELFKDPRSYGIDPKIFLRVEPKRIEIEEKLINKIIIIWDFLINFNKLVNIDENILSNSFFDFYNKISCESFYIYPKAEQKARKASEFEREFGHNEKMEIEEMKHDSSEIKEEKEEIQNKEENETNKDPKESTNQMDVEKENNLEEKVKSIKELEPQEIEDKEELVLNINKNYEIFQSVVIQMIKLFSSCLSENDINDNMKIDKNLFIVKFCSENNFIDFENFYMKCYPAILKILVHSKRFSLMANDEVKSIISQKLEDINTEQRVEILFYLVNAAYDLTSIKDSVKKENDLRNDLFREKNTLEYELKAKDNRKKEIEKMEKFLTAQSKIDLLTDRINKLDENPDEILKIYKETNVTKLKKDLDVERERYKSLLKENEELGNVRTKIIARLDEIRSQLNNLNLKNKKKIGQDYKKNDYFIFEKIPNILYVFCKQPNLKPGSCFINAPVFSTGGYWAFYDEFEYILNLSNLLTEKGIREKSLKSSLRKLISKKFFSNDETKQRSVFDILNECCKLDITKRKEILEITENQVNNHVIQEVDKENQQVSSENNIAKNQKEKLAGENLDSVNFIENITELEKQNKILNEIFVDIQNIDDVNNNNLENILENGDQINVIPSDYLPLAKVEPIILNNKKEEADTPNEEKQMLIEDVNQIERIDKFNNEKIPVAQPEQEEEKIKDASNNQVSDKIDNNKMEIDDNLDLQNEDNNYDIQFDDKELILIRDKILLMEEKFSEYLRQYEKEWEIHSTRKEWKKFIEENYNFKNIYLSIKMLNLRFKNPYRSDEPALSDTEVNNDSMPSYVFKGKEKAILKIFEFDNTRVLAPKVKIWSRDLEINEIEKYFCDSILYSIDNISNLYIAYFLFEGAVYSLIKRRDPYKKSSIREMSIGLDNASINLVYANSSQNLTNNINIDEEGLKRNDSNINNIPGTENENNYFETNQDNLEETGSKKNEKSSEKQSHNLSFNKLNSLNNIISTSRTRSTRLMNPVNYNINYNLNTIFNQAGLSSDVLKPCNKVASKGKKNVKNPDEKQQSKNEDETLNNDIDENQANNFENENSDETLSENNTSKKKKKRSANTPLIKKKLAKNKTKQADSEFNNESDNNKNDKNLHFIDSNMEFHEENDKTNTLSEQSIDDKTAVKKNNSKNKTSGSSKTNQMKKLLNNKRKRIQDESDLSEGESSSLTENDDDEEDFIEDTEKKGKDSRKKKNKNLISKSNNNKDKNLNITSKNKKQKPDASQDLPFADKLEKESDNNNLENLEDNLMDIDDEIDKANKNRNTKKTPNKASINSYTDILNTENCYDDYNSCDNVPNSVNNNKSKGTKNNKNNFINQNAKQEKNSSNKNLHHTVGESEIDYNSSLRPAKLGKPLTRFLNKSAMYDEDINTTNSKQKRLTRSTNSEVIKIRWNEKCYICLDFGDLLCCEECSNVAHKFCACVEKIPEKWYCQKCLDKKRNTMEKQGTDSIN